MYIYIMIMVSSDSILRKGYHIIKEVEGWVTALYGIKLFPSILRYKIYLM